MRGLTPLIAVICLAFAASAQANELLLPEHSVMFYWAVPIGAEGQNTPALSYGMRLDPILETLPGSARGQSFKMKPASLDFEISKRGIKSLKFSGHNVLHSSAANFDF